MVGEETLTKNITNNTGLFLHLEDSKSAVNIELLKESVENPVTNKVIVQTLVVPEKSKLVSMFKTSENEKSITSNKNPMMNLPINSIGNMSETDVENVLRPTLSVYSFKKSEVPGLSLIQNSIKENPNSDLTSNNKNTVFSLNNGSIKVPLDKISFIPSELKRMSESTGVSTSNTNNDLKSVSEGLKLVTPKGTIAEKDFSITKITIVKKQDSVVKEFTDKLNIEDKKIDSSLRKISFSSEIKQDNLQVKNDLLKSLQGGKINLDKTKSLTSEFAKNTSTNNVIPKDISFEKINTNLEPGIPKDSKPNLVRSQNQTLEKTSKELAASEIEKPKVSNADLKILSKVNSGSDVDKIFIKANIIENTSVQQPVKTEVVGQKESESKAVAKQEINLEKNSQELTTSEIEKLKTDKTDLKTLSKISSGSEVDKIFIKANKIENASVQQPVKTEVIGQKESGSKTVEIQEINPEKNSKELTTNEIEKVKADKTDLKTLSKINSGSDVDKIFMKSNKIEIFSAQQPLKTEAVGQKESESKTVAKQEVNPEQISKEIDTSEIEKVKVDKADLKTFTKLNLVKDDVKEFKLDESSKLKSELAPTDKSETKQKVDNNAPLKNETTVSTSQKVSEKELPTVKEVSEQVNVKNDNKEVKSTANNVVQEIPNHKEKSVVENIKDDKQVAEVSTKGNPKNEETISSENKKVSVKIKGEVKSVTNKTDNTSEAKPENSSKNMSNSEKNNSESGLNNASKQSASNYDVNANKIGHEIGFNNVLKDEAIKAVEIKHKVNVDDENLKGQKIVKSIEVIKEIAKFISKQERGSLSFDIKPESLGKMKISLDTVDHVIKASIEVENEQAKQLVEKNIHKLHQELSESGIQLNSLNISLGNPKQNKNDKQINNNNKNRDSKQNQENLETVEDKQTKSLGYNTYEFIA